MPLKSKKNSNINKFLPYFILILFLDLLFLYYLKYFNQHLSLKDFNLFNIGNILNLIFALTACLGVVIYIYKKKSPGLPALLSFILILNVVLVLAAVSIFIVLPFENLYLFARPFNYVLTGFLFLLYQIVQFIFISFLWMNIWGGRKLIILRALVNSLILILISFLFAFLYMSGKPDAGSLQNNTNGKGNIAVVLGAAVWSNNEPSPSLASRTEKAAELFHKGIVEMVQLTGSNAPGELSEAEVAYNYIKKRNVDTTHILIEKNTTSTAEQIEFIKNNLMNKREINKVLIVSDSYHLTRIKEICKFYDVDARVISSDLSLSFENKIYYKIRESVALVLFWFFAL